MDKKAEFLKLIDSKKVKQINIFGTIAIGKLRNFKGFQRVNLNLSYLKEVVTLLEKEGYEAVDLFVRNDVPIQIGNRNKGYLIAPRLPKNKEERYKLSPIEDYISSEV